MRRGRRVWAVAFVVGCGSSSNKPPDAGVDSPPDAPLRTIAGAYNVRVTNAAGSTELPVNLSQTTIAALVPPDFTAYPGSSAAAGTFTIPGVPAGTYYLQIASHYFVLSANSVDLSFDALGRATDSFATSPTDLTFDVTGLTAWQTTDELALFSTETGTAAYAMQASANAGAPAASDTSLSGFVYDLSHADQRALIDTTMGDHAVFSQLSTQSDGTRSYRTIAHTLSPSTLTVANGGSATISGAVDTPAASATLSAVWDRPAFAAQVAANAPGSSSDNYSTFALTAMLDGAAKGHYSEGPDIVVYAPGYQPDSTTLTTSWSYADPYPADWTRIVFLRYYGYRFARAGSTGVAVFSRMLAHENLATVTAQAPIEPIVGLPHDPLVNGQAANGTATLTAVGTTPTIAWSAPTLGTVSRYYVAVSRVQVQGTSAALQQVIEIETSDTQVTIPPNVLASGQLYTFEIAARSLPSAIDLTATPYAFGLPEGFASITTTTVTP